MLSSFAAEHRCPISSLAEPRNRLVVALADVIVIAHASHGSKIDRLYVGMMTSGKRVYILDLPENTRLMPHGVMGYAVPDLANCIRRWWMSGEA